MTAPQNPTPEPPGYQPPPTEGAAQPPAGATPPPQGYYPPAGQPQAYPPAGAAQPGPYPPAGYQPAAPGAYQMPPGAFQPGGPAPTGSNKKGLAIGLILRIGIPVALVLIGVIWALFQFNVEDAKVGDCLVQDGTDSVKAVKCDDPSAKYQVVRIFEDQKEPTDFTNPCNDIADADASYWEGKQGSTGRILCLKKL